VVKDVERDVIEFITKTLNCLPIANIEHFREDKLGHADLVEEVSVGDGKIVKITWGGLPLCLSLAPTSWLLMKLTAVSMMPYVSQVMSYNDYVLFD
jgi:hypothetical protein